MLVQKRIRINMFALAWLNQIILILQLIKNHNKETKPNQGTVGWGNSQLYNSFLFTCPPFWHLRAMNIIKDLLTFSTISGSRNHTISTVSGSRIFFVHFYNFWIQKFFGPYSQFLDLETAVFLKFLDPETAPFLRFLGALWIVGGCLPTPCRGPMDRRARLNLT